jgi:hypothetical protein
VIFPPLTRKNILWGKPKSGKKRKRKNQRKRGGKGRIWKGMEKKAGEVEKTPVDVDENGVLRMDEWTKHHCR